MNRELDSFSIIVGDFPTPFLSTLLTPEGDACKSPGLSLRAALSLSVLCPMNPGYLDLPGLPAPPCQLKETAGLLLRSHSLLHSLETQDSKFSLKHIHTQFLYILSGFFLLFVSGRVMGFPGHSDSTESACNAEDLGSIPGLGRSPGGGHGNPLQYSCLENPHGQRNLVGYSAW